MSNLLVSMSNHEYDIRMTLQITADLLHQVFALYGGFSKILVVQNPSAENRQQALIYFESTANANQAMPREFLSYGWRNQHLGWS